MRRALQIIFWTAILNFVLFLIGFFYLGGAAMYGYAKNGHYFLGDHQRFTEVSRTVFLYSRWHVYSFFVLHPLGLISALLLYKTPLGLKGTPKVT
jgi:hypothetical protein